MEKVFSSSSIDDRKSLGPVLAFYDCRAQGVFFKTKSIGIGWTYSRTTIGAGIPDDKGDTFMATVHLLITDPQNDFCLPGSPMYAEGAELATQHLAQLISRIGKKVDDIHVTLDSHHECDVCHPVFWRNASGTSPEPGTIITSSAIRNGEYVPTIRSLRKRMEEYVRASGRRGPFTSANRAAARPNRNFRRGSLPAAP